MPLIASAYCRRKRDCAATGRRYRAMSAKKISLPPTKAQNMSPAPVIVAFMESFEGKPRRYPSPFPWKGKGRVKADDMPETRDICTHAPTDNRHAQPPTDPGFENRRELSEFSPTPCRSPAECVRVERDTRSTFREIQGVSQSYDRVHGRHNWPPYPARLRHHLLD